MSTTATRGRGRPRTFDEEAVLDALTSLFWRQGYEATSIADITQTAGLNKSSLYNTFGSKQELFSRILTRYITARMTMLDQVAGESGDGLSAIHSFLEMIRLETQTEMGRHGCLAVNVSAELGAEDEMAEVSALYRSKMFDCVNSVVQRAAEAGEIDAQLVDQHTRMFMTFMLGLSLTVRSGASNDEVGAAIDAAHATVDSWAT